MPARRSAGRPCLWNDFKRRSVHEAALRLLARDGFEGLTMEALAREVGVAKGTLYLHFPDKRALLDEVVKSAFEPLEATLVAALDAPGEPEDRLLDYCARYEQFFAENVRLFRALLLEAPSPERRFERFQNPRYLRLTAKIEGVLEEGIRRRRFRRHDSARAAVLLIEMNFALCGLRLERPDASQAGGDAGLVADLFLTGLRRASAPRAARKADTP